LNLYVRTRGFDKSIQLCYDWELGSLEKKIVFSLNVRMSNKQTSMDGGDIFGEDISPFLG
jgi:hypothetical protein